MRLDQTVTAGKLLLRRALDEDIPEVCELLKKNFVDNLTESQKKDGFLSILFTEGELREMADNGVMIVALFESRVVGFLTTQTCEYNLEIPIARTMVKILSDVIDEHRTLVCGPVCIDGDFRGLGILEQMYGRLALEAEGSYDTGITFVSDSNPRSIAAHRNKLGMTPAGQFEENGKVFRMFRRPL